MINFGCCEEQTLWLSVEGQSLVFFSRLLIWPWKTFNMSRLSEAKWPWHGWLWIIIKSANFLSILLKAFLSSLSATFRQETSWTAQTASAMRETAIRRHVHGLEATFLSSFPGLCWESHLVSRISETGVNWRSKLRPGLIVKEITLVCSLSG